MSSASRGESTRSEELDTILQFAEESSTRELFAKETELTQTWLSGASQNDSLRGVDGSTSSQRFNHTHTSVDINDSTSKRLDVGNDPHKNDGSNKSENVNDVETSQGGHDVNELQKNRVHTSDVSSKSITSSTSTDEVKHSPTDTNTTGGDSAICEGVGGRNKNEPVVAKVNRRKVGGSCSSCNCSYFCRLTGIMKIIEILTMFLALIVTVAVDGACYYSNSLILVNGVMLMGLTVTPTLLVCYLLKQTHIQTTLFEVIINGFLALYSVVAGCSVLGCSVNSSDMAVGVVLGLFLIVAGLAYVVDCVLALLKYRD